MSEERYKREVFNESWLVLIDGYCGVEVTLTFLAMAWKWQFIVEALVLVKSLAV